MAESEARAGKGWWGRYGGFLALALAALALLSGGLTLLLRSSGGEPVEILLPEATPPQGWQVFISGAVAKPGLYELSGDVSLERALQAAGSTTGEADLPKLQLHVPSPGQGAGPLPTYPPQATKININAASAADLAAGLQGIGPVLAERIVQYREEHGPFGRIEDIVDVKGIGPAIFQKIKDSITVGP